MRDDSSGGTGDESVFMVCTKKLDDLKNVLETGKEGAQLDAMKKVIGYIAKGRDASALFPSIVKLVASSKPELKKLVYVYLDRYAQEQQELALLSISTFQRGLKDHNQLIRGCALRVLSSIRVPIIAPILLQAIKEASTDMSPYVRKTAAHAIPKLAETEESCREELIEIISRLLGDKAPLVSGSAVLAYRRVCPGRIDLIHKNFRKLCQLLIDVDEWGQLSFLQVLANYSRTQFIAPSSKPLDPDHKLLLTAATPLLQSRNSAVVISVVNLFLDLAPEDQLNIVVQPLVSLATSHCRETKILAMKFLTRFSSKYPHLVSPFMKHFFLFWVDGEPLALLKIEILVGIAIGAPGCAHQIVRELETISTWDKPKLAAEAVTALGKIACKSQLAQLTLPKLLTLLNDPRDLVSGESIVSIRKLIQHDAERHSDVIKKLGKVYLQNKVTSSSAKSSIIWLIGEYHALVPTVAPDVLRVSAKNFIQEEHHVKLQIINLCAKMSLLENMKEQTKLAISYIFKLARYDQSYDIRDRARLLKHLVFDQDSDLYPFAKEVILAVKPAPVAIFNSTQYRPGTLSDSLGIQTRNYQTLPDFPTVAPPSSVRDVKIFPRKTSKTVTELISSSESESESESEDSTSGPDSSLSVDESVIHDSNQCFSEQEADSLMESSEIVHSEEPVTAGETKSSEKISTELTADVENPQFTNKVTNIQSSPMIQVTTHSDDNVANESDKLNIVLNNAEPRTSDAENLTG